MPVHKRKEFVELQLQKTPSSSLLSIKANNVVFPENLDHWFDDQNGEVTSTHYSVKTPDKKLTKNACHHKTKHNHLMSVYDWPCDIIKVQKRKPKINKARLQLLAQPYLPNKLDQKHMQELCADIDFESDVQFGNSEPQSPVIQKCSIFRQYKNDLDDVREMYEQDSQHLSIPKTATIALFDVENCSGKCNLPAGKISSETVATHTVKNSNKNSPNISCLSKKELTESKRVTFKFPDTETIQETISHVTDKVIEQIDKIHSEKVIEQIEEESKNFRNWFNSTNALSEDDDSDLDFPLTQNLQRISTYC